MPGLSPRMARKTRKGVKRLMASEEIFYLPEYRKHNGKWVYAEDFRGVPLSRIINALIEEADLKYYRTEGDKVSSNPPDFVEK